MAPLLRFGPSLAASVETRIRVNEKTTARNEAALMMKTQPMPMLAMSRPATPGPISRAALNDALFKPTALGRSSSGTISVTKVWRDGESIAATTPDSSAST